MKEIEYHFADKTATKVEVSDEFAEQYKDIVHKEELKNLKETRRHQSLEQSIENGYDFEDKLLNIEQEVLTKLDIEKLNIVIKILSPLEKLLIHRRYYEQKTLQEISLETKMTTGAINDRINRIIKHLRKFW